MAGKEEIQPTEIVHARRLTWKGATKILCLVIIGCSLLIIALGLGIATAKNSSPLGVILAMIIGAVGAVILALIPYLCRTSWIENDFEEVGSYEKSWAMDKCYGFCPCV